MSGGVFGVSRDVFEHPMFRQKREFSRLEAWLWLLSEAAWKGYEKRVGGKTINVKRGQVCASIRFMADAWGWHAAKVQRFVDALKTDAMIDTASIHGFGVITICNYNEYQRAALPEKSQTDTPIDAPAIQQRYSSDTNEKEREERNKEINTPSGPAALPAKSLEAQVFEYGKGVLGKSSGGVIVNLRKACEYDDPYALELLKQAAEKHDPMAWIQAAIRSVDYRPYRGVINAPQNDGPEIESREDREYKAWAKRYYATVI